MEDTPAADQLDAAPQRTPSRFRRWMIYLGLAEPFGGAEPSAFIRSGRHDEAWRLWFPLIQVLDVAVNSGAARAVGMAVAWLPYSLPRIVNPVNGKQRERDHPYLPVAAFVFPLGFWGEAHQPNQSLVSAIASGAALALIACTVALGARRFVAWRRSR